MFPIVHPGVAYLLYSALRRLGADRRPGAAGTLALVLGALLPDLVDQSLYRLVELPSTRTLAHSLLVAVPVCVLVVIAVRRTSLPDEAGAGFSVGYLSHPLADALWPLLFRQFEEVGFLLWPLTDSPPYVGQKPLLTIGEVTVTTLWVELPLLGLAVAVWWRDGRPGTTPVRDWLG